MASGAQATDFRLQATRAAAALVEQASLEIGVLDIADYAGAHAQLLPGQKIYVSFLPRQDWQQTFTLCARLSADGFEAVPHIPVRTLESAKQLEQILTAARQAGVREPLLISGDYPDARRPFSSVLQVLQTGILQAQGFSRVSLAGHPEGHPHVSWDVICEAQVDKWRAASAAGLAVTFVTQFFFSVEPFVHWARYLRAAGVEARLVAGVAGPTGLGRLIKLARHCGVGASLRSLTARPAATVRLFGEHAPDDLLTRLAAEKLQQPPLFDGLHVFSLGGFARSVAWLRRTRGE